MRGRGLAGAVALAAAAALLSISHIAVAQQDESQRSQQEQERDWTACVNSRHAVSADAAIAGCTRMIEAGEGSRSSLAGAYSNRGNAYQEKGDLDHAMAGKGIKTGGFGIEHDLAHASVGPEGSDSGRTHSRFSAGTT